MTRWYFIIPIVTLVIGYLAGYFMGLNQQRMLDKVKALEQKIKDTPAPPEPTQGPGVLGGAYQPPREVSTTVDNRHKAGLVEAKTPEMMAWENKNELAALEKL